MKSPNRNVFQITANDSISTTSKLKVKGADDWHENVMTAIKTKKAN